MGNKYALLRYDTRSYKFSMFETMARNHGWNLHVIRCGFTNHKDEEPYQMRREQLMYTLSHSPSKPTLILLHGTYRAGFVFPCKLHIGFVWEDSKNPRTDTLVQGLPGRICGYSYNTDPFIRIYLSSSLLEGDTNEIKKFILYHEDSNAYTKNIPNMYMHSKCTKPQEGKKQKRYTTQPFRIPNEISTISFFKKFSFFRKSTFSCDELL